MICVSTGPIYAIDVIRMAEDMAHLETPEPNWLETEDHE